MAAGAGRGRYPAPVSSPSGGYLTPTPAGRCCWCQECEVLRSVAAEPCPLPGSTTQQF